MSGGAGRIRITGDRAALVFERRLPYPVETVWAAITDPAHRGRWFGPTTIDPRPRSRP